MQSESGCHFFRDGHGEGENRVNVFEMPLKFARTFFDVRRKNCVYKFHVRLLARLEPPRATEQDMILLGDEQRFPKARGPNGCDQTVKVLEPFD